MSAQYATKAETMALMGIDRRTEQARRLDVELDRRGAFEQGAEPYIVMRQIACDLMTQRDELLARLEEADSDFEREGFGRDGAYRKHIVEAIAKVKGNPT